MSNVVSPNKSERDSLFLGFTLPVWTDYCSRLLLRQRLQKNYFLVKSDFLTYTKPQFTVTTIFPPSNTLT